MTISGSTIIRNGVSGGFPFVESILSILDFCDEFVACVDGDDGTKEVLEKMARRYGKIRLVTRPWPIAQRRENAISLVTNWAFAECRGDWLMHLQGDEVLHPRHRDDLLRLMATTTADAIFFHRLQLSSNFQQEHCSGHCGVLRAVRRGKGWSGGDGLSFVVPSQQWVALEPVDRPQIIDATRVFLEQLPGKLKSHADFWPELNAPGREQHGGWYGFNAGQMAAAVPEWMHDPRWTATTSPFWDDLPPSLQYWVGKTRWYPREELISPASS